jgi:hypothetical protein
MGEPVGAEPLDEGDAEYEAILDSLVAERGGGKRLSVSDVAALRLIARAYADSSADAETLKACTAMMAQLPVVQRGPQALEVRFVDPKPSAQIQQNEMLKARIAELEREVDSLRAALRSPKDAAGTGATAAAPTISPEELNAFRRWRAEREAPIVASSGVDTLNRMLGQNSPGNYFR